MLSSCTGHECTFDGSASNDPDGVVFNYDWEFGDGVTFDGKTISTTGHRYGTPETYAVILTVADDEGAKGGRSQQVTVSAATIADDWAKNT